MVVVVRKGCRVCSGDIENFECSTNGYYFHNEF